MGTSLPVAYTVISQAASSLGQKPTFLKILLIPSEIFSVVPLFWPCPVLLRIWSTPLSTSTLLATVTQDKI